MKKKNLFTICAASGLCLIFALALVWGMSIYAEKSGTQEFEPQPAKNESSDMITELMADDSQTEPEINDGNRDSEAKDNAGPAETEDGADDTAAGSTDNAPATDSTEDGLINIARAMYAEYKKDGSSLQSGQEDDASLQRIRADEAVLILLKEVNRIYPQDSLADLKISYMSLECSTIPNSNIVYWTGKLENGYGPTDDGYRSYSCQIDSISGKIVSFGKFRPYQKDVDYTAISWTDEEIKEQAKQLSERYGLSQGEEFDWENVEIYNAQEEINSLKQEFEERPDLSRNIHNTLNFENYSLCLDWETGELGNYLWVERTMP